MGCVRPGRQKFDTYIKVSYELLPLRVSVPRK